MFGNAKIVVSGVSSLSFVETLVWLDDQLLWWVADASGKTVLFGISRYVLQKKFADVLASLDLDDCGYTLGSLRAGGATDFFQRTRNLGELQYQGREDGQQPQICNIISWKPFLLCDFKYF